MDIKASEVHTRTYRTVIDAKQLELMIAEAVAAEANRPPTILHRPGLSYAITFEDVTTGSPPQKVGTRAVVVITEDLMMAPIAAGEQAE